MTVSGDVSKEIPFVTEAFSKDMWLAGWLRSAHSWWRFEKTVGAIHHAT